MENEKHYLERQLKKTEPLHKDIANLARELTNIQGKFEMMQVEKNILEARLQNKGDSTPTYLKEIADLKVRILI